MGVTSTSSTSSFALPLTPFLTKKMEPEITRGESGSLGGMTLRGSFPASNSPTVLGTGGQLHSWSGGEEVHPLLLIQA